MPDESPEQADRMSSDGSHRPPGRPAPRSPTHSPGTPQPPGAPRPQPAPDEPPGADRLADTAMAPWLAFGVTATAFAGLCLVGFQSVLYLRLGPLPTVMAAACMLALLALQMLHVWWAGRPSWRTTARAALAAQAVLVYAPMPYFAESWSSMPGFLAGSALLVLPPLVSWVAFAAVMASVAATQWSYTGDPPVVAYAVVATVIIGLAVYGLSHLRTLVSRLRNAQDELARAAVARERLRFSGELHDLLGNTLSAITLKAEVASRLVATEPSDAQREVDWISASARQALTDVRLFARGHRVPTLGDECRSARSVLAAAGVSVRIRQEVDGVPQPITALMGEAIREGVTNVLRHSRAGECEITVRDDGAAVVAEVVNDGVAAPAGRETAFSGGLGPLSQQAGDLNGTLAAAVVEEGRFRLTLTVPLSAPQEAADDRAAQRFHRRERLTRSAAETPRRTAQKNADE